MPTHNWMYFGNRARLDTTPTTNATAAQLAPAVGWTATGSDEMGPTAVTGTASGTETSYRTTYQTQQSPAVAAPAPFSYTNPVTGASVTGQNIVSFYRATFDVRVPDSNGNLTTVQRSGVMMQMRNGDVFFRPSSDQINSWDDLPAINGVTVTSVTPLADNVRVAQVGFNPAIYNVPITCFAGDTLIATERGDVRARDLSAGDKVWTVDNGLQEITWVGLTTISARRLDLDRRIRPIRIKAGALGNDMPERDLLVSPQHRVLVQSKYAQLMFGMNEVLIAAKHLVLLDGIDIADDIGSVDYVHFLLGQHEIVLADGARCESMFTGPEALKSVPQDARDEIMTLFPELAEMDYRPVPARRMLSGKMSRTVISRHVQHGHRMAA
ncbi:Hint domain-containing protein [Falsirhodobacter halotolerans]|uniref:Hint domain-containing protein n=1 Tax=Falsirhodobacter halotolerans TaxID=1146892 RepID=UPI001FD0ED8A|nr:Hint domain-containing protein [Falsirhodobacter halotolerans]MCJ8139405.1 Hint domain-containing protein [Falsirhodobacter halotolerans]